MVLILSEVCKGVKRIGLMGLRSDTDNEENGEPHSLPGLERVTPAVSVDDAR